MSTCELCKTSCPSGGVNLEDKLKFTRNCNECMQCVSACPTGAIEADVVNYSDLITKLQEVEAPVLGCSTMPDVKAHARVPCLGLISKEISILMIASLNKEIKLNLTQCGKCECDATTYLQNIKASLPRSTPSIALVTDPDKLAFKEKHVSRRSFFSLIAHKTKASTSEIIKSKFIELEEVSHGKKSLPMRIQMINHAEKLGDVVLKKWIEQNLRFDLSTSEECDFCGECRAICPTGAIKLKKGDEPRLMFQSERCSGCQLCVEFCPISCLEISKKKRIEV